MTTKLHMTGIAPIEVDGDLKKVAKQIAKNRNKPFISFTTPKPPNIALVSPAHIARIEEVPERRAPARRTTRAAGKARTTKQPRKTSR